MGRERGGNENLRLIDTLCCWVVCIAHLEISDLSLVGRLLEQVNSAKL
jgi:hypothetical protein